MEQVIYTSIAARDLDGGEIFRIVSNAAAKNRSLDITGMLVVVDRRFFQAIEGPKENLEKLMNSLERDPRHHSFRVLRRRTITGRQFGEWSMQRFRVDDVSAARLVFRDLMAGNEDAAAVLRKFEVYLQNGRDKAA